MSDYILETAGRTIKLGSGNNPRVSLVRLQSNFNRGKIFEFILHDIELLGLVGLRSSVRLSVDGVVIFSGFVFSECSFFGSTGSGKRIVAQSSLRWCEFVRVTDSAGVPRIQFTATTVGQVLSQILNQHASEICDLGLGSENFYSEQILAGLDEPVDHLWIENRSLLSVLGEVLTIGEYSLDIDSATLFWQFSSVDDLDIIKIAVGRGSANQLIAYSLLRDLSEACSAVRLVSNRKVSIGYGKASPAWDGSLESSWQLRTDYYSVPNASDAEDSAWVYRRFSYDGISELAEEYPIELVQKVPTDGGGWTYQLLETQLVDREGKYIVSRYPILKVPEARRINKQNAVIAGKAKAGDVYIRYRYYESEPEKGVRFPPDGFAGQVMDTAGLKCLYNEYVSDERKINLDRAHREWKSKSSLNQAITLSVRGDIPADVFRKPVRLRIGHSEVPDLSTEEIYLPSIIEYDFIRGMSRYEMQKS